MDLYRETKLNETEQLGDDHLLVIVRRREVVLELINDIGDLDFDGGLQVLGEAHNRHGHALEEHARRIVGIQNLLAALAPHWLVARRDDLQSPRAVAATDGSIHYLMLLLLLLLLRARRLALGRSDMLRISANVDFRARQRDGTLIIARRGFFSPYSPSFNWIN